MSWLHVKANPGMGLQEKHLRRIGPAPALYVRRDTDDRWEVFVMEVSGLSGRYLYLPATLTLLEAKDRAEQFAREAGWRW